MAAPADLPPPAATAPATFSPVPDTSTWRDLGKGVILEEVVRTTASGPQRFWIIRVPPGVAQLRVERAAPRPDGRPGLQPVAEMARRSGALAAVNGGYFSPRDRIPLGLVLSGGELVSGPLYHRTAVILGPEIRFDRPQIHPWIALAGGESAEVDYLNLPPQGDALTLFTPAWGARTGTVAGSAPTREVAITAEGVVIGEGAADLGIPPGGYVLSATGSRADWLQRRVARGDRLSVRAGLDEYWGPVGDALGGGPLLVSSGTASISLDERFRPDITRGRAARTAIGLTPDGTTLLVGVAEQGGYSIGMTLSETASLLCELGADQAMNLDGGSSTTVWAAGATLSPRPGAERPVSNAVVVIPR